MRIFGLFGRNGRRNEGQAQEVGVADGLGEVLTAAVVGQMGKDEPRRIDVEPPQRHSLTHEVAASVESRAPCRVDEDVALFRSHAEPHMVLQMPGGIGTGGTPTLAVHQSRLHPDRLAEAIEEFAVALADSGATLVGFVGRADLPGAVISDVVAKPEVDALRLLVVGRRRTYDAACQRGVVVRGGGDVVAHTIHGPLPSGSGLQPLSCCGAGEAEQEKDREVCLARFHKLDLFKS